MTVKKRIRLCRLAEKIRNDKNGYAARIGLSFSLSRKHPSTIGTCTNLLIFKGGTENG